VGSRLVGSVSDRFELEGAVLDVEVVCEAFAEGVQDQSSFVVREDFVANDDVH